MLGYATKSWQVATFGFFTQPKAMELPDATHATQHKLNAPHTIQHNAINLSECTHVPRRPYCERDSKSCSV